MNALASARLATAKPTARVALCGLDAAAEAILIDIFRQLGIEAAPVVDAAQKLQREKYEGIVVRLGEGTESLLDAVRRSASNHRIVVFAVANHTREALAYSRFGINAILLSPIDRSSAFKTLRATRTLLIHELRRYVRLPVVTAVELRWEGRIVAAPTIEVSAGGMCVDTEFPFNRSQRLMVRFALPGTTEMNIPAEVCWAKPADREVGLRFEQNDPQRALVRRWIDDYLEKD